MAPRKSNRESIVASTTASKASFTKAPLTKASAAAATKNRHQSLRQIALGIWDNYQEITPQRTKLLDTFLGFLVVVGVLQFIYCIIAGNYPFNAFLSGFSATVGQFVLTTNLRIQTNDKNNSDFMHISPERAFADYVFGSLILHFFCVNFIN